MRYAQRGWRAVPECRAAAQGRVLSGSARSERAQPPPSRPHATGSPLSARSRPRSASHFSFQREPRRVIGETLRASLPSSISTTQTPSPPSEPASSTRPSSPLPPPSSPIPSPPGSNPPSASASETAASSASARALRHLFATAAADLTPQQIASARPPHQGRNFKTKPRPHPRPLDRHPPPLLQAGLIQKQGQARGTRYSPA
jgi:hypothetical protein